MHMVESKPEDYVLTFYQMQPSLILFSAFHDSQGVKGQRFERFDEPIYAVENPVSLLNK